MRTLERGGLPGQGPLQDWEDINKMNIDVNIYGGNGQHAKVRMHLPKDENYEDARLTVLCMFMDLKHSKPWTCEFCGAPARETQMQTVPYVFFPICRLPVYVHHVCDMDKPECQAALRATHDRINREHKGIMGPHPPQMGKPPGEVYPLSASCANCKTDASADVNAAMKRCGGCKVTRYCSAKCQKEDWPRHKFACKAIKSAEFDGWPN
ncbi:hypothetical protein L226DRAFT_471578 [Lentinus tigrinus ALCF2SS1-7]|uniref:MYND-type domain-containing protein n=1 Tax=Lentinus tigrinus ALCF2SS1-6 TaxID=1328759 RepID=A0A5C2SAX6_9APHY|nr:hypothetical protein L227DRAFT_502068 [Lentinus tigrinus ALCF2SS1-6]RPD69552.1 hypothetical protein L226DRAFT_471578 [Lentinus tigrinus ALCF2SS1-7]